MTFGIAWGRAAAWRHFLIVLVTLASRVTAWWNFPQRLPNGDLVTLKGEPWPGVGHMNPMGGGKRNPFGKDFAAAGLEWTTELCEMDSDGDGRSNGMELGDPECLWVPGDTPSRTEDITHPGFDESAFQARSPYALDTHSQTEDVSHNVTTTRLLEAGGQHVALASAAPTAAVAPAMAVRAVTEEAASTAPPQPVGPAGASGTAAPMTPQERQRDFLSAAMWCRSPMAMMVPALAALTAVSAAPLGGWRR